MEREGEGNGINGTWSKARLGTRKSALDLDLPARAGDKLSRRMVATHQTAADLAPMAMSNANGLKAEKFIERTGTHFVYIGYIQLSIAPSLFHNDIPG